MTLLERIEALVGQVIAYDGRLAFWTRSDIHDVRDIAPQTGCPSVRCHGGYARYTAYKTRAG